MTTQAPSPLHRIDCALLKNGARCTLAPLSTEQRRFFAVTLATDREAEIGVVMIGKGVRLLTTEELTSRRDPLWTLVTGVLAGILAAVLVALLGHLSHRIWPRIARFMALALRLL
jgi:hypothetical protein